ncbi:hypothetical protein [Desulfosediminicola flagellatus]|uniref:hypothetical protein n=1 Tax=Desulfosediminicola flagellatus TaxID=2569541 RepID=UPI0010AD2EE1|nr:hypothetical protein [Desulfosediminicola flagellatus]
MKLENRKRKSYEYIMKLEALPQEIFPLLCPVREYDWIPGWQCTLLYSKSGFAELGCVFKTDYDERFGDEIWVVSEYVPDTKITFVRTGNLRTTRYEITLKTEETLTTLNWMQEITALNNEGDKAVLGYDENEYKTMMESLYQMLNHYLKTGSALVPDSSKS